MPRTIEVRGLHCGLLTPEIRWSSNGVSFSVGPGEVLFVEGRSGSGKSALLEICAGLRSAESGEVLWDGRALREMSRREILIARRRIGYMFQVHALISNLTILDNIALPLRYHGVQEKDAVSCAMDCMERLGLTAVSQAFPEDLSYGLLRKAALARAIVNSPELLLLDEPMVGVDRQTVSEMCNVIGLFCRQIKPAVVITGENDMLYGELGGRRTLLADGELVML